MLIYGQFIEHILDCIQGGLCDEHGLRPDVVAKMKEMAPTVLRFPGGTVMCQYHWEDAIGPMESRIRRPNLIWGGEIDPAFGTAEFICLCREIGAEPMICVNMASGTPEEAAHWVEYCNGTGNTHYANLRRAHGYAEPFNVKYWCIGNECYAEPDIGIQHDVTIYTRDAMEFIKWMKLTDRSIQTVVVGCDDESWNRAVLNRLHAVTDFFSYHHYSGTQRPFEGERQLSRQLDKLRDLINEYPDEVTDFPQWYRFPPRRGKIRIALDEWGIWDYKADETYGLHMTYPWRDALWVACVLNQLIMRPEIGMANFAQSVNVLAMVITNENGSYYQTIAYPWLKYREHMVGERVFVLCENPHLSLSAVRRTDGTVCTAVVNRSGETQGFAADGRGKVITLTAQSPESVCSMQHNAVCEQVFEYAENVTLPPYSVSLIIKE